MTEFWLKGVTLLELMVVVIIVGILAGLAFPQFTKAFETTKAREAVAALQQIRAGERVYRIEENTYWRTAADVIDDNTAINIQLSLSLDTRAGRYWDFSLISVTNNTFTGRARRKSGRNTGETITIDEDGEIDDTSNWSP